MQKDTFASLGVSPFFVDTLKRRGIVNPTGIQLSVIPRLLSGESLIFRSETGTGKTFAYLLPFLQRLISLLEKGGTENTPPCVQSGARDELPDGVNGGAAKGTGLKGTPLFLIAAPTFELCSQIKAEVDFLLKPRPREDLSGAPPKTERAGAAPRSALLIGSASMGRQIETLKKERPEIIVGNPGRLLALARSGKLKLRNIRFAVLDEGDSLVRDEVFDETKELFSVLKLPFAGAACSATIPEKSKKRLVLLLGMAKDAPPKDGGLSAADAGDAETGGVFAPESASFDEKVLVNKVEHWAFFSPEREKFDVLRSLIAALAIKNRKKDASFKALVFSGKSGQAERIASRLNYHGLKAAYISGKMDRRDRKNALDAFRSGKVNLLVSSDLAARGLDISGISHIIALDVNEDRDIYIHRAGRTARAGKNGVMASIGTEGEMRRLAAIEKKLKFKVYPKVLYGGRITAPDAQNAGEETVPRVPVSGNTPNRIQNHHR